MSEAYNDALKEQSQQSLMSVVKQEVGGMSLAEAATVTADVVGIFDPSPTSDIVGGLLSAAQGDILGAALSAASLIPYAGDALAKPAKLMKYSPRIARAVETVLKHGDDLATLGKEGLESVFKLSEVAAARKKALDRVKKAMLDARNKVPGCQDCAKLTDGTTKKGILHMPTTGGKWDTPDGLAPTSGSGIFVFDAPKVLPDGRTVDGMTFKDGFPDFDNYVEGGKHDLWVVTGDVGKDSTALAREMREAGDPDWLPPSKTDYVLHHFEDGMVGYVPRVLHDKTTMGGVAHTGGNSMVNNQLF